MIEKQVSIATKAGSMDTFVCHPERGGPFPVLIFYMDAPGIREELRDMARRLGTVGYYVLLPNLYYRLGRDVGIDGSKIDRDGPDRARMVESMKTLNPGLVNDDTEGMLAFIDRQPEAKPGALGCVGYCMSGPFVVAAGARFPERFAAIASIYGTELVTDKPDSPHRMADRIKGEIYFACAELDRHSPPAVIEALRHAFTAAGTPHEVELYPAANHAFGFPSRAAYDKTAAERHWERLFALFQRRLG
jgi:carboxymethylenebutenolidase